MKVVAIYARVSSAHQAKESTIESQISELKKRAEEEGHIVLPQDVFVDDGYSGATLVRPGLERLRDRIDDGSYETIYIHSPDRLSRKYAYQVLLIDEFQRCGVTVVFIYGPQGESAEDELLVQVQGIIAEYERARIMERCRRGKIHRARQGIVNPLSGAPYGYLYVKKTDGCGASYRILLHEAKIVRQVFNAYVYDGVSIGEIVRTLNAEGTATRRGAPRWDRSTVWALLRNPTYMGKAAYGKTEVTERRALLRPIRGKSSAPRRAKGGYRDKPKDQWVTIDVPAVVSQDVYEAAQLQSERNKRLAERNGRGERYLLQGLTVCSICGYAYYGKPVTKATARGTRQYAYYRCTGTDSFRFAGGRVCNNQQVRVDQLDGYVWQSVCELLRKPERLIEEWSLRSKDDCIPQDLCEQRDDAERILSIQERSLKRLVDAYEAGVIELCDLEERTNSVRNRIERARNDLVEAEKRLQQTIQLRTIITRVEEFAGRVRERLESLTWKERRDLIRLLVARVEIDKEGATIVYRLPPSTPRDEPQSGEGEGGSRQSSATGCQLRGRSALVLACEHLPA